VNARAISIATAISDQQPAGVRDVIATYRSVAIHFDPLSCDINSLRKTVGEAAASPRVLAKGSLVEVPVAYGGDNGPDLDDVAAFAKLSTRAVIDRHCGPEYRVFMLGFLPGFAYMGIVDESIAAPRKATPRTRIPAGSVGIAGRQTGVYPRSSPGGWQLIGRTPLHVFDPTREPASLFRAGDRVKFVATAGIRDPGSRIRNARAESGTDGSGSRIPDPGRSPSSSQGSSRRSRTAADGVIRIAVCLFQGQWIARRIVVQMRWLETRFTRQPWKRRYLVRNCGSISRP
jgi:KipI family sensor histidine kinase inhibitor